jgi:signal transduction histidine kinase
VEGRIMASKVTKKLGILVVENNPVDEKVLHGMLERSSHGTFSAKYTRNFKDALEILKKKKFDAVLLDLNLPDMKGISTLKKMITLHPTLPVVVNTGVYQDSVGLKAIKCGAQDYLIKGKYKPYTLSKSIYYAVQRKKIELELKEAYQQLTETQSQLIQAEKMNVVGGIASGVAHEVKNPLATILYGIEFMKVACAEKCTNSKVNLTLKTITTAAQKANNIVIDLLDFAGMSKLKKEPENIENIILEALNLTHHQVKKKGITIEKKFSKSIPKLKLDKNRIEQVIVDIFLNAVHAMDDNGKLTIKTHTKKLSKIDHGLLSDNGRHLKEGEAIVVVDIGDTGPGIS